MAQLLCRCGQCGRPALRLRASGGDILASMKAMRRMGLTPGWCLRRGYSGKEERWGLSPPEDAQCRSRPERGGEREE